MRPDDPQHKRPVTPLIPQRPVVHTPPTHERQHNTHVAAANVARTQLDHIYNGHTSTPTPQTTPVVATTQPQEALHPSTQDTTDQSNPYERTHAPAPTALQADQWKQYHSAWQEYYQKYYERYYVGQMQRAQKVLEERVATARASATQPEQPTEPTSPQPITRDEALYDLRSQLMDKVRTSAKKVRGSRHFIPITAAVCVMLVFLFLQYNRVIFSNVQAYISPGNVDPANIIVDPSTDVPVSADPKLIIPKINVDVPIVWDATPDNDSQMAAMEKGVAYFGIPGANSKPGQIGNTVLSGHSSNDILDGGDYKFIFARLDQLQDGDSIFINYESKRYTYTVTKKEVVKPTEVNKLVYPTDKPVLTLITCTPLGTATNRLLVTAEQVSPSPSTASPAPSSTGSDAAPMPGNSPTFVERILGQG
ncbi:class D sortase [Streptomyces caniscabiei]|uniref:sortase n=1 Tax=Streptomyces caniscabiei TaxID=2746961 RepID=UPI0029A8A3EA|nr:class D sortase [Streptomyces caniscabiei]MDX2776106.1 class D sortase [Streptomyces caniscabiei]